MGTFTTKLKLGGKAFVVHGGWDPYIEEMTVGQIRIIETLPSARFFREDPCYLEEYMCIETGVGSGNVWKYGYNIFATMKEAEAGVIAHQQAAWFERARRAKVKAEQAEAYRQMELAKLADLKRKYEGEV